MNLEGEEETTYMNGKGKRAVQGAAKAEEVLLSGGVGSGGDGGAGEKSVGGDGMMLEKGSDDGIGKLE